MDHRLSTLVFIGAFTLGGCDDGGNNSSGGGDNDTSEPESTAFDFTALGPVVDGTDYPDRLTATADTLHFVAKGLEDDPDEVYVTDGTPEGTRPFTDLKPTISSSYARELTAWKGDLYFVASRVPSYPETQEHLLVLDESEEGNVRTLAEDILNDEITPGTANVAATEDTLFFVQHTAAAGREVYRTDGTASGVELVADINTTADSEGGTESSEPEDLTASGDRLFFTADDGNGRALWVTDGTESGTRKLLSGADGSGDLNIGPLYAFDGFEGQVFFRAFGENSYEGQPWVSDGTEAGTEALDSAATQSDRFARLDDSTILFGADDALWSTDGTPGGTSELADAASSGIDSETAVLDGKLYFRSGDREIWKTDGTEAGTALMMDMGKEGSLSTTGRPDYFTTFNGQIFFTADPIKEDAVAEDDATRLWVTDGTEAGTEAIAPSVATEPDPLSDSFHDDFRLVAHDGALFFSAAFTEEGRQLWKVEPAN